jgi:hypothetical protein
MTRKSAIRHTTPANRGADWTRTEFGKDMALAP